MITRGQDTWIVFVDIYGREVAPETTGAIELRSPGPGWRWHDASGHEWGSAGAALEGERLPRWRCRVCRV